MDTDELRTLLKQVVKEVIEEEVKPSFMEMVKELNAITIKSQEGIIALADMTTRNLEVYEEHLNSLEKSRDRAHKIATSNQAAQKKLEEAYAKRERELMEKNEDLKKDLETQKREYHRTSEAYIRLSEIKTGVSGGTSKSDVKINM